MTQFITMNGRRKDVTGQRFGRLTALGPIDVNPRGGTVWLCLCDCGQPTKVQISHLTGAHTRSCGCLQVETVADKNATHGLSKTPSYKTWKSIIKRCTNPNFPQYADYGGRGISVCSEWRHDFQAFYDYVTQLPDYGEKGYSIDRIDNDGDYEPGNVRWADKSTQTRNTRYNRIITHNGKTQCATAWAEELQMPAQRLLNRLRRGWSVERAFGS